MRIIAGKYKGKKLKEFDGTQIRPTSDRAREGIFSALQFQIEGKRFLDGFCGSGAVGIEALSRGASEVVFTDLSKQACELAEFNLKSVGEKIKVKRCDLLSYLAGETKPFDIIFLDPPYKSDCGIKALEIIAKRNLLTENGVIVYESGSAFNGVIDGLIVQKRKKYGIAEFAFFCKANLKACVFAGSFDPFTNGHLFVVNQALEQFDKVIVLLAVNANKKYKYDKYTKLKMLNSVFENNERVEVAETDGLLVDFLRERRLIYNVRGIRNQADVEYEEQMYSWNREHYPEIKNIYFKAEGELCNVSSSYAREKIKAGEICEDLPPEVAKIIQKLT